MIDSFIIRFQGPFSWGLDKDIPSIFDAEVGRESGVYLWTVSLPDGELIYYVGETGRSFAQRMLEHFKEHSSGGYHLCSPEPFARGEKIPLWPGRFDPDSKTSVADFLNHLKVLWPAIIELAKMYRFFLAPFNCDRRLRQRIEAAIANCLYEQAGIIGSFQERGVRYIPRRKDESPITVSFESPTKFLGLPDLMEV
jgi:hypothetical protein